MGTIYLNTDEATDKVEQTLVLIESDLQNFTDKYTALTDLLQESEGGFTDVLKEQLGEEKKAMEASILLLETMCTAMREAIGRLIQADSSGA